MSARSTNSRISIVFSCLRREPGELLVLDGHELPLRDLVPLDHLVGADLHVARRIPALLLDGDHALPRQVPEAHLPALLGEPDPTGIVTSPKLMKPFQIARTACLLVVSSGQLTVHPDVGDSRLHEHVTMGNVPLPLIKSLHRRLRRERNPPGPGRTRLAMGEVHELPPDAVGATVRPYGHSPESPGFLAGEETARANHVCVVECEELQRRLVAPVLLQIHRDALLDAEDLVPQGEDRRQIVGAADPDLDAHPWGVSGDGTGRSGWAAAGFSFFLMNGVKRSMGSGMITIVVRSDEEISFIVCR